MKHAVSLSSIAEEGTPTNGSLMDSRNPKQGNVGMALSRLKGRRQARYTSQPNLLSRQNPSSIDERQQPITPTSLQPLRHQRGLQLRPNTKPRPSKALLNKLRSDVMSYGRGGVAAAPAPPTSKTNLPVVISPTIGAPKKSCLKKTSSYGQLEKVGTNIPIQMNESAWNVLKVPGSEDAAVLARKWSKLHRVVSDPSLVWTTTRSSINNKTDEEEDDDPTETTTTTETTEEKEEAEPPSNTIMRKAVSFSSLEIRSYNITVGDHPSCRSGPPISLDWTYSHQAEILPIQDYEDSAIRRRTRDQLRLGALDRNLKLRNDFGVPAKDLRQASRAVAKIQQQRHYNNRSLTFQPEFVKWEETLESAQRKVKKVVLKSIGGNKPQAIV